DRLRDRDDPPAPCAARPFLAITAGRRGGPAVRRGELRCRLLLGRDPPLRAAGSDRPRDPPRAAAGRQVHRDDVLAPLAGRVQALGPARPANGRPLRSLKDVIWNHMESVGTKAYTSAELHALFGDF